MKARARHHSHTHRRPAYGSRPGGPTPADGRPARLRVLFEDDAIIAVEKPARVPTEGGAAGVVERLIAQHTTIRPDQRPPVWKPAYRLDVSTGGVLLLSKTRDAGAALAEMLRDGRVRQEFVAVVRGMPGKKRLTLSPADAKRAAARRSGREPPSEPDVEIETLDVTKRYSLIRYSGFALKPVHVRLHLGSVRLPVVDDLLHLARVSLPHPETGRRLSLVSAAPSIFDERLRERAPSGGHERQTRSTPARAARTVWRAAPERVLEEALKTRSSLLADPHTTAVRLLNGAADGAPGLSVEKLNDVVVLQVLEGHSELDEPGLTRIAAWYRERLGLRAVYAKHFARGRSMLPEGADPRLHDPVPLAGEAVEPELTVLENGLNFVVRPYDGYSVGLFLDQRDNRRRIRELAAGRRVLNLFAYTCGFSVAAAAGGADETVSVDLSVRHLEWGKQNFAANGINLDRHIFIRSDASSYLGRSARQERAFDLIVLDPPTFARMKKPRRTFTIGTGLRPILSEALAVLKPGGQLLVSTNSREHSARWLHTQVAEAAGGRRFDVVDAPPLPADFASDPDYAKSLIVRFD